MEAIRERVFSRIAAAAAKVEVVGEAGLPIPRLAETCLGKQTCF